MLDLLVRYRRFSVLLVVMVGGVSLLALQRQDPGEATWLVDGVAAITAPVQLAVARVHRGAAALWTTYLDWKGLRADHARLRAEVTALRLRQLRQDELEVENSRLRGLVTLRERLPTQTIGAEVVGREWNGFTRGLTVDRGRADGVERLAPVIVTHGVVGRVAGVRRSSSVIQVLTDPASSIGGVVNRTRAQGLVEGVAGGKLRLKLAASEEGVKVGDLVFTSGIGELFPKGLPLGRVLRVYPPTGLFRTAELEPAVNLATVEEVFLLPRGSAGDLAPAFPDS
ncbi:MAG TPA: rod shape-determining protein MreC [Methylomirabilota bacterium]|nr:rod shape-determining protein MreC [Methylomirabilota bacterium]